MMEKVNYNDKIRLSDEIVSTVGEKVMALRDLHNLTIAHTGAVRTLATEKRRILLQYAEPKDLGANEAARAAKLDQLLEEFQAEVNDRAADVANARYRLEILDLQLSMWRELRRIHFPDGARE